jgi:hypothetical protein
MIEVRLSLAEARWLLQALDLRPSGDSPLADPLAGVAELPGGSSAEARVKEGLASRGILVAGGTVNPFAAEALRWLAGPEETWALSLFGRGGAALVHLVFREGMAVECRRDAAGFTLRFPLPEAEAREWLRAQMGGGTHGP